MARFSAKNRAKTRPIPALISPALGRRAIHISPLRDVFPPVMKQKSMAYRRYCRRMGIKPTRRDSRGNVGKDSRGNVWRMLAPSGFTPLGPRLRFFSPASKKIAGCKITGNFYGMGGAVDDYGIPNIYFECVEFQPFC